MIPSGLGLGTLRHPSNIDSVAYVSYWHETDMPGRSDDVR
jgi:hypothetical protein